MSKQLKTQNKNKIDFYKSYIGKNISIYGREWKITDARELDKDTILMYYGILGGTGIINSVIVKDIETGKYLDDMEKEQKNESK